MAIILANATKVTDEYPRGDKVILEILENPWNWDKGMLLVDESDVVGVDLMGPISNQTKKNHLNSIYGPYMALYKRYKPPELPLGIGRLLSPSAVYCTKLGYEYKIRTLSDGGQVGYYVFEDSIIGRKECPAWDFYSGLSGEEYSKTGSILLKINEAACVLPFRKICYEWDYSQGGCR